MLGLRYIPLYFWWCYWRKFIISITCRVRPSRVDFKITGLSNFFFFPFSLWSKSIYDLRTKGWICYGRIQSSRMGEACGFSRTWPDVDEGESIIYRVNVVQPRSWATKHIDPRKRTKAKAKPCNIPSLYYDVKLRCFFLLNLTCTCAFLFKICWKETKGNRFFTGQKSLVDFDLSSLISAEADVKFLANRVMMFLNLCSSNKNSLFLEKIILYRI